MKPLIMMDEQHVMPVRGNGRIITTHTTYYFWYRARHNKWYMGVHQERPILNGKCDVLEYDDKPCFHTSDVFETCIKPQQVDELMQACVVNMLGTHKNRIETNT